MQTRRSVATIPIECTLPEMHALKMRITELKDDIPEKTGEASFDFETVVGKARYRWQTYISTGSLAAIATVLHKDFAKVLRAAGF